MHLLKLSNKEIKTRTAPVSLSQSLSKHVFAENCYVLT